MAKKSRRARARQGTKSTTSQPTYIRQAQSKTQVNDQSASSPVAGAINAIKINPYDYVASDLIRIGIIAGGLLVVLIVLTFVLR